jgi:protein TonB
MVSTTRIRFAIFLGVALLHLLLIFFLAFKMGEVMQEKEPAVKVMKLVDVRELVPQVPVPPPPPPKPRPPTAKQPTVAPVAENMVATDKAPEDQEVGDFTPEGDPTVVSEVEPAVDYLAQSKISKIPGLAGVEDKIRKNLVYPSIALRSGVEGTVILELFIDKNGDIRRIAILKEDPADRGFGEAAVNAFNGIRVSPAETTIKDEFGNPAAVAVAVRYRYPVRFKISG